MTDDHRTPRPDSDEPLDEEAIRARIAPQYRFGQAVDRFCRNAFMMLIAPLIVIALMILHDVPLSELFDWPHRKKNPTLSRARPDRNRVIALGVINLAGASTLALWPFLMLQQMHDGGGGSDWVTAMVGLPVLAILGNVLFWRGVKTQTLSRLCVYTLASLPWLLFWLLQPTY